MIIDNNSISKEIIESKLTLEILLLFTYGVSLKKWKDIGIINRETSLYKYLVQKKKIKFFFLTYGLESEQNFPFNTQGINVHPVKDYLKTSIPKFHYIKSLVLPLKFKSLFQRVKIIKTNQIIGSWVAVVSKIFLRKKIIIRGGYEKLLRHKLLSNKNSLKSFFRYYFTYIWIFLLELIAYRLSDGIILTNLIDIQFIINCFKLKKKKENGLILHTYNFIETKRFQPIKCIKKAKSLLYIGSLKDQKNLKNLLLALKDLKDFKLNLIGDGPMRTELESFINIHDVNAEIHGYVPNEELPYIINQHEIFILPSYWEGNPKALLEAMSCGIPCIGSNIPGISEIISHKQNGYLCGIKSQEIKNAIDTLHQDVELKKKIARNARKFVLENCSLSNIAENEYKFYKKVLNI